MRPQPDRDAANAIPLAAALLAIVAAVTLVIILAEWPWIERAIALEDAPIAWFQSTLIAASAVVSLCHATLDRGRPRTWYVVAAALFMLAIDERFMGHERLKEWIWVQMFDGDVNRAGRWPDVPILFYAIGGAATVAWIARAVRSRFAARLIWSAITVGTVALVMDVTSQSIALQIWEELLELLAEALFFIGLLTALASAACRPPA